MTKPVAWIRYCSDDTYEGPILDGRMEEVRKQSRAWTPLYEAPAAPALVPLTLEQINRIDMTTEWPENSLRNIGPRSWGQLLVCVTRAVEAAHGIKP